MNGKNNGPTTVLERANDKLDAWPARHVFPYLVYIVEVQERSEQHEIIQASRSRRHKGKLSIIFNAQMEKGTIK